MKINSLAFRLIATALIWVAVALPLAAFAIQSIYAREVLQAFQNDIETQLLILVTDGADASNKVPSPPKNLTETLFNLNESGWYWQISPVKKAAGPRLVSGSLATGRIQSAAGKGIPPNETGIIWHEAIGPGKETIRVAEMIIRLGHKRDGPGYSFLVARDLGWAYSKINDFRFWLGVALAIAALALLAMIYFQVRFALKPLQQIGDGLQAIRSGKTERLEGDFPHEVRALQQEMNALMQSNQEIIERARTQVGNLAHALKTPLAVITNEAGELPPPLSERIKAQAKIMRDQVSLYLDRARMAARVAMIGRITDVAPVIEALQRALEKIYRDKGIKIRLDLPEIAHFQGERHDLEEMLGNLMDNACKWAESTVWVSARLVAPASPGAPLGLEISVDDDGPGLSAEQREQITKRGLRLDESKPGSGLGLSIVKDLATTYRGSLRLEASPHGGLKALLVVPRPPDMEGAGKSGPDAPARRAA